MKYVWFKSYDGNNLEDVGLVEAAGIDDAYNKLYESHGYNNISDCITMIPLEDLLRELIYSSDGVLSLMDKYMEM